MARCNTKTKATSSRGAPSGTDTASATERAIIDRLNLLRPIYRETTNYGHFGRPGLPWEVVEKAAAVTR